MEQTHSENTLPESPAGVNTNKALAQNHKTSDMQNAMRVEVVHLNPVEEQKASDEIMQRKAKSAKEKIRKTNSFSRKRHGEYLIADWSSDGNNIC